MHRWTKGQGEYYRWIGTPAKTETLAKKIIGLDNRDILEVQNVPSTKLRDIPSYTYKI